MTRQDRINHAITHYIINRQPPGFFITSEGDNRGCMYLTPDGAKCAVGCQHDFPSVFQESAARFSSLLHSSEMPTSLRRNKTVLIQLQNAHDNAALDAYREDKSFISTFVHELRNRFPPRELKLLDSDAAKRAMMADHAETTNAEQDKTT